MKIGIVGAGLVGSTAGYTLVTENLVSELVFVDKNEARAEGEAMDVSHATPFSHPARVVAGSYEDLKDAAMVIVTAGANQKEGETRLDLAAKNATIFRDIIPQITENVPDTVLLIATNPVDVLTHVAWQESGLPKERVIGSGTILDTARLRSLVSEKAKVAPQNVHGYVLGEHGDSEIVAWSHMDIAGTPLKQYFPKRGLSWDDEDQREVQRDVQRAAYNIIQRKGATYYGVATGIARIAQAVLGNQQSVLTVSMSDGEVAYSLPRVLGRDGVVATLEVELSEDERSDLDKSIGVIREAIESASS